MTQDSTEPTRTASGAGMTALAVRPDEAAVLLAISRSQLFAEIRAGRLRSAKVGRARLISVQSLHDFLRACEEEV